MEQQRRYCGRNFNPMDITKIRQIITDDPKRNRTAISKLVCEHLGWYKRDGHFKEMSCRVALLRMHRDGLIVLPAPQKRNVNGKLRIQLSEKTDPPSYQVAIAANDFDELQLTTVITKSDSSLWNEYIARYHYLGHAPLPGAQMRFFVRYQGNVVACLGFGAAAWRIAPRDKYIGWSDELRQRNLHLVVNNARFLILPWITTKNLASKILSLVTKQIPSQWKLRYGYAPLLMETFVECQRFRGTCYKAANWVHVGITKGRGKLDVQNEYRLPVKEIFLYPLQKNSTDLLCAHVNIL
jgi:hypothetical protein